MVVEHKAENLGEEHIIEGSEWQMNKFKCYSSGNAEMKSFRESSIGMDVISWLWFTIL